MTTFETLPRRIFLDSCTAQTLRDYGSYIYEAEPIEPSDRIYRVSDGFANLEALRNIFAVSERAMFEWIVSRGSMEEAHAKRDPGHMQWLWDIADHSEVCLRAAAARAMTSRNSCASGVLDNLSINLWKIFVHGIVLSDLAHPIARRAKYVRVRCSRSTSF